MKKLLLIEDDCFMREMVTMVLESKNFEVVGAETGAEALRLLQECAGCDAVIADMYLPDTDGLELFEQINAIYPEAMFVMLSSETDQKIVSKADSLGIKYIFKDENFAESIVTTLQTVSK